MATEEPQYEVIEKDGAFELRDYAPYLVAETQVDAGFEDAGNVTFVMPAKHTLDTLPQPRDKSIRLRETPGQRADRRRPANPSSRATTRRSCPRSCAATKS